MDHLLALGLPGILELLVLAAFAVGIFLAIRFAMRRGQAGLPSAFPVIPLSDGPGSYKVCGVDRQTRADKELLVQADSRANAQVKAELDEIVVTSIEKIR